MMHVDCSTEIPLDLFNELQLAGARARNRGQHVLRRKDSYFGMRSEKYLTHPPFSFPEENRTIRTAVLSVCCAAALTFSPEMVRMMSWISLHNMDRAGRINLGSFFQSFLSKVYKIALHLITTILSEVGERERKGWEARRLIQLMVKLKGVGVPERGVPVLFDLIMRWLHSP